MEYKAVRKQAEKDYKKALSQGRYPFLPVLDQQIRIDDMAGEEYLGTMEIPVHMIVGTKTAGRENAFSHTFLPLLEPESEFATKWISLYQAQVTSGITDPIKVYEFMHRFYVAEGNKRVSVMKYLGADSITASVTRILPPRTADPEVQLYYEFVRFYEVTGYYGIQFSQPGRYCQLAELFGQTLDAAWPEEAVTRLKNTFVYFGVLLAEKGGGHLPITAADAMLIYLSVYRLDSLEQEAPKEIKWRMDKLWKEFRTGLREEVIDLVESPEEESHLKKPSSRWFHGRTAGYSEKNPLLAAFIHEKNPKTSGWVWSHEQGIRELASAFPSVVKVKSFPDCDSEEAVREAIDQAAAEGAQLIITTSPRHIEETYRSAIHYKEIRFMNCSIHTPHQAVKTYYARLYEAKFILGAVAASLAENHRIGYRAYYPVYGAISNINAFAAGARLIDPDCKVRLEWASSEGNDWRGAFAAKGIRFISGKTVRPPSQPEKEQGLYRDDQGHPCNLLLPIVDWGQYYRLIVRSVLSGTWDSVSANTADQALNYTYGMNAGVIDLRYSPELPEPTCRLAGYLKDGLTSGLIHPFEGRLADQTGRVLQESGRLNPMDIITMDWLLENVEGSMPDFHQLKSDARKQTQLSGIIK